MIALRADNVGKKYDLYRRPADRLKEMLWPGRRAWHREIWALEKEAQAAGFAAAMSLALEHQRRLVYVID
mgnify:CR=1 FL=1